MMMWTKTLSNKFAKHYLIYSLIISIAIFSSLVFLITKLNTYPLTSITFNTFLEISSTCALIGYQCVAIKYSVTNIKPTFDKLKPLFNDNIFHTYSDNLDKKIQKSKMCYFIILLIVISFILLELIEFLRWKFYSGPSPLHFSLFEPSNQWALAFDIFNYIITYLALFLLAIIVWRVINLIEIVNVLDSNTSISVDIFHVDEMGGLRPLRNFILIVVSNYFIILTLAIISYISPAALISYEMVFLIILLLLGVILFVITLKTIRNLITRGLKQELGKISAEYKKNYNKSITIISDNEPEFNRDELKELSLILDILEKERTKIKQLGRRRYEFSTIITFICSFLLPTITLIEKIRGLIV